MHLDLDIRSPGRPLVPFWRVCAGGGRVAEALRADFQKHLELIQSEMPFQYLRMHGLFHEDMMVYREEAGRPVLNWQYVDLVYDHWLSIGIRPFVELGFMPYDLASGDQTCFWWKGNVTPPKDGARWEWLVGEFLRHALERYGLEEVRRWYFEVWNEPNLAFFWQGADFEAYLDLYARTAKVIKEIDPHLRVGGPATSGFGDRDTPPWGREFLAACRERGLPLDFFSTHPYPTLHPLDADGNGFMVWDRPDRLSDDLRGVDRELRTAGYGGVERHFTEWSSSPSPRDPVHDTAFMAPFLIRNNLLGCGLADSLSYWTVSDIFEENRLGDTPFHGGFGLVNAQGLKKPAYHGYWFLSRLGPEELARGEEFIATRHADGRLSILIWNYCHYSETGRDSRRAQGLRPEEVYAIFESKPPAAFTLGLGGLTGPAHARLVRFDRAHGSAFDAWAAMGAPAHIRREALAELRRAMELPESAERIQAHAGTWEWSGTVEPHGVILLEIVPEGSPA